jgi:pSer/pThr/pTyr-binding forkhead associated (FHA) protein
MWKLVIEDDEARRTAVPLTRDEYSIGRKEGNSIRLTERNVSREHVRLRKHTNGSGPTYMLEDLKSYNGVYVNGIRVPSTQELVNGDLIQIGDYRIIFQEEAPVTVPSPDEVSTAPPVPVQAVPLTGQVTSDADLKATNPGVTTPFRGSLLMERPNRLVMLVGPTPGVEYPLDRDRLTIGRAEDATISINHNSVSRLHCEIHLLGEGRYEIVDKGSSNGIRVNAAELRRGIVEAGDLIELGDVRLKFVAAGQVFVPGPNESQQLTAISDRIAPDPDVKRGKSGVLPFAILGAVVALLVLGGGLMLMKRKSQQTDTPTPATSQPLIDQEKQLLQEALAICTREDCQAGHVKATTGLRETSPMRESADFQKLESTWADYMFAKADAEPDYARRKEIYQKVSQTLGVDQEHRKSATDRLDNLDKTAISDPSNANSAGTNPANTTATPPASQTAIALNPPGTSTASATGGNTARPVPPHPTGNGTGTGGTTAKPPAVPDVDKARALLLDHPEQAKFILYNRLTNKPGTADEYRVLLEACKAPSAYDKSCIEQCKKHLGN